MSLFGTKRGESPRNKSVVKSSRNELGMSRCWLGCEQRELIPGQGRVNLTGQVGVEEEYAGRGITLH